MSVTHRPFKPTSRITFEDLKGLRARGYVRDSSLDQRDGFGPDIQRRNIVRFADSYGLVLNERCYTEFVSGRSAEKRAEFQQFIEDARQDLFDVLLADHTSRFGRNQEECIRYKAELRRLGKVVVFVSQGIISGTDRDFLAERINETLDEAYSRNLSRYVVAGCAEKAAQGYANGRPPLGYKSVLLAGDKREAKSPDEATMPVLLELLRLYATGQHSYQGVADLLNTQGHRTRAGELFTKKSVASVVSNRFYEGKVVHHPDQHDREVVDGIHPVPGEVRELWLRCQEVRMGKQRAYLAGRPREQQRAYPFARLARCAGCGTPFGAKANPRPGGGEVRMLVHRANGCRIRPHSVRVEQLTHQFAQGVLPYVVLDDGWKQAITRAMHQHRPKAFEDEAQERNAVLRALENLRKQHLWGDLTDEQYRAERLVLERRIKALGPAPDVAAPLPDLERAAALLADLPALWSHPGVEDRQREVLVRELLERVDVAGGRLIAFTPKEPFKPLFAYAVLKHDVRNCPPEPLQEDLGA